MLVVWGVGVGSVGCCGVGGVGGGVGCCGVGGCWYVLVCIVEVVVWGVFSNYKDKIQYKKQYNR